MKKFILTIMLAANVMGVAFATTYPARACQHDGDLVAHAGDSRLYYECHGKLFGGYTLELHECPMGHVFHPESQVCDWPPFADCL